MPTCTSSHGKKFFAIKRHGPLIAIPKGEGNAWIAQTLDCEQSLAVNTVFMCHEDLDLWKGRLKDLSLPFNII